MARSARTMAQITCRGLCRGRLGRRLYQLDPAGCSSGLKAPKKGADRPLGPYLSAFRAPGPGNRLPAGSAALVGSLAEGHRDRDHGRAHVRVWMEEWSRPRKLVRERPGRWVGEPSWPPEHARRGRMTPGGRPASARRTSRAETFEICSPETTGYGAGCQCCYGLGPERSADQRIDDAQSLCFDSAPLAEPARDPGRARGRARDRIRPAAGASRGAAQRRGAGRRLAARHLWPAESDPSRQP